MSAKARTEELAPHSIEAEEAVLGAILIRPECMDDIRLRPDEFFVVRHRWIYEAMRAVGPSLDPAVTLPHALEERGRLSEIGGRQYIATLLSRTPSSLNVEGYASIVHNMAVRRQLSHAAGGIARLAHSEETDLSEVLNQSQQLVAAVADTHMIAESVMADEVAGELITQAKEYRNNPATVRGLASHVADIDSYIRGFRSRRLYLLCGRPGMGKSAMLFQIAQGFARGGTPVLIFSLEMDYAQVVHRMACQHAQVDSLGIEDGTLPQHEYNRYIETLVALTEQRIPLYIVDTSGLTISDMQSITRRHVNRYGVDVVFVDTANRVKSETKGSRYEQATEISHRMADWAHDPQMNITLLTAAQLNRSVANQSDPVPTLSDLRDTGAWEEDADGVLAIHRPYYYDPAADRMLAYLYALKMRQGRALFKVKMAYRAAWTGFTRYPDINEELGLL
jgi:replicative DNA helicase